MNTQKIKCPSCKTKVTIQGNPGDKIGVSCPNCNTKGFFTFPGDKPIDKAETGSFTIEVMDQKKRKKTENNLVTQTIDTLLLKIPPFIIAIVIGSIFIITGGFALYNSPVEYLRIGITFSCIGGFVIFLISDKRRMKKKLLVSEKITIIFSVWLFISFILTTYADIAIFFIVFFIGFLIIKELLKSIIPEIIEFKLKIIVLATFAVCGMLALNTLIPYFKG